MAQSILESAQKSHAAGRLAEAATFYQEFLLAQPDVLEALEGLGIVHFQMGRIEDARAIFERGVMTHPQSARLHARLGAACRNLGRLEEARDYLQKAIDLDPTLPDPWNSLGRLAFDQRQFADAKAAYRTSIRLQPQFAPALKNLGATLLAVRQWRKAAEVLRSYLQLKPDDPEALANLAQALGEQGNPALMVEAESACRQALALAPGLPAAFDNLGNVLRVHGRLDEAMACYNQALAQDPHRASSHRLIGHVLQHCGRFDEATRAYEAACVLQPDDPRIHADLGSLAFSQGNYDGSADHYLKAVELDPTFVEGHQGRAQALLELGQLDEAEIGFNTAIQLDRALASSWVGLARLQAERGDFDLACQSARAALVHQPGQADALWRLAITLKGRLPDDEVRAMERLLGRNDVPDRERCLLHFGLAGVHDARGDYPQAAAQLETANAIQAGLKAAWGCLRDPAEHTRYIDRLITAFSPELLARCRGWVEPDLRPVFVVGLARSGTTLVEQILASHPQVHGAGELRDLLQIFEALPSIVGQPRIDPFQALEILGPESAKAAALSYLETLSDLAPEPAARVVDKMPDNVELLGLIAVLWPGSNVILCKRDLRDIAVSCWSAGFETNPWTNNWELMARHFADYLRLVEHWRRIRPLETLEVRYETLVADLEAEARRMIDFLGLDWNPACLDFQATRRVVRTASLVQVRQPVHSRSIGRWRNYESHLQPLFRALEQHGVALPET